MRVTSRVTLTPTAPTLAECLDTVLTPNLLARSQARARWAACGPLPRSQSNRRLKRLASKGKGSDSSSTRAAPQIAQFLDSHPEYTPDGWPTREVPTPAYAEGARPFSRRPSAVQLELLSSTTAASSRNGVPFWLLLIALVCK